MLTSVDELETDRIFQMSFIEFLEGIARVAEKLSPIPVGAEPVQLILYSGSRMDNRN